MIQKFIQTAAITLVSIFVINQLAARPGIFQMLFRGNGNSG